VPFKSSIRITPTLDSFPIERIASAGKERIAKRSMKSCPRTLAAGPLPVRYLQPRNVPQSNHERPSSPPNSWKSPSWAGRVDLFGHDPDEPLEFGGASHKCGFSPPDRVRHVLLLSRRREGKGAAASTHSGDVGG
jgi:hypothetical protein